MLSEIPYHVDFIVCRSYWFCKGLKLEISIYTIKRVAEVLAGYPKSGAKNRKGKLGARLVMEFKNCCLKRYENCGLKSVVEKRVFSVQKHVSVFLNTEMCLVCVCLILKKS